ncbi:hypothetical protein Scep_012355 [Stephania cephalantha]|uniref:Uncharacterized protein n=1 Tax=Stephania cephalantha TaxID=152367 RepID=A0AAP0JH58_9MAGN
MTCSIACTPSNNSLGVLTSPKKIEFDIHTSTIYINNKDSNDKKNVQFDIKKDLYIHESLSSIINVSNT